MSDLLVQGGLPLAGRLRPSGNKNSALPVLCATLFAEGPVVLKNMPEITDLEKLVGFFRHQGSSVDWDRAGGQMRIDHSGFRLRAPDEELPLDMRSTVLLYPGLLHRHGRLAIRSNATGCSLGVREIDPHLEILEALGASVERMEMLRLELVSGFKGTQHWCDYMSVTVTENFAMAAAVATGESVLINAASEPHVQDLCRFLVTLGACIEGIGTSRLRILGTVRLGGGEFTIGSDYHEIVTFLALGAITGGEVFVENSLPEHFGLITKTFAKLGVRVEHEGRTARVRAQQSLRIVEPYTSNLLTKIEGAPWPYFSVDLLPLMIALATRCSGTVHFWNKVYENGFSWIPELAKYGAHAVLSDPHRLLVFGDRPLRPAVVDSPYVIRAAVALTMVAACIPGQSVVRNAEIIRRAHPRFVENLRLLGANLSWR